MNITKRYRVEVNDYYETSVQSASPLLPDYKTATDVVDIIKKHFTSRSYYHNNLKSNDPELWNQAAIIILDSSSIEEAALKVQKEVYPDIDTFELYIIAYFFRNVDDREFAGQMYTNIVEYESIDFDYE